ncbi:MULTISPECIES: hypothetical protein [unclassified Polaribacter]|uniref:hypothetical protein n=1 Tax=unclassified Polaribacter TaxID=196858 RepID=UPI0011BFD3FD|nr:MULTISPECIES: hypothetical protein [unclassified Polaribacter]TXD50992.1 hypothetical protein ES043_13835 [Polaribacter sp. IC063]TXD57984.1 hypothetical protein ES044_13525 [Polaribacter sp. IC066]
MKTKYISALERGILTSVYKQEIRRNITMSMRASLSKVKSLLYRQSNIVSQTGTMLQVSLLVLALVVIVS